MSHTFDNIARREGRRREREHHITRMEEMDSPQLEHLHLSSMSNPQEHSRELQRPGMGKRQSSRSLVDFDSQQLLSMEEIHENVLVTASRLLNDADVSSLEEDEDNYLDNYPVHDQLPSPEDARMYAGLLMDKSANPNQSLIRNSARELMNLRRTIRGTKGPNESFVSSLDVMSMEMDLHEIEIPSKRTGLSASKVACVMGTILIAVIVAIIVALKSSESERMGPSPSSPQTPGTPQDPSTPQAPITPRMKAVIDYLARNGVSDPTALNTNGTPQQQAADWIANTDIVLDSNEDESRFIQRYVMAVFYYSLGGPEWKKQANFLGMEDECSWSMESPIDNTKDMYTFGITCNAYSRAETIMMPDNNLVGSLPSELGLLTALDLVALNHNQISGSIPDAYQSLKYLEGFELQYNKLTGTLPSFLGDDMKQLRVLSLSNNKLQGQLPSSMSKMKHLTTLALDDNKFSGDMASVVNGMVSLQYLYVDNNSFDSMIDNFFLTEIPRLEEVDLSGNQFATNDLPPHLFLMAHLRVLDLHDNDLAGSLPNDIPKQVTLEILDLSSNRLSGTIPSSIQQLRSLTHLDVSSNQFSGLIPDTISSLQNLTYLFLSNNRLEANPFPEFVVQLTNLRELSMAKTSRFGIMPEWLGELSDLVLIDLSENELTGTIPDSIWNLPSLKYLLLRRNYLEGRVSEGLVRAENLGKFGLPIPMS